MSPEGWNESGLDGPEPAPVVDRDVLSLQRMSLRDGEGVVLVQTQRRCSSKGSSVVSFRGVGGSPVFSRVGSIVWVTPRGSCVRLTSCKGAGGAGCKRWDWFFRAIYIYIFLSRHVPYRARLHRTLYYSQRADFEFWPMSCQRCSTTRLNTLLNCLVNAM